MSEDSTQSRIDDLEAELRAEIESRLYWQRIAVGLMDDGITDQWYKHKARGTAYNLIDASAVLEKDGPDSAPQCVYRGNDGKTWVRPAKEFFDGRFEDMTLPTPVKLGHMERFKQFIADFPAIKAAFSNEACNIEYATMIAPDIDPNERIMLAFAVHLWRGDNPLDFDLMRDLRKLPDELKAILSDWVKDPYWP